MAQLGKRLLTGSTNGRPILQVAVASPGTTVHTVQTTVTTSGMGDEIWLWAYNADVVPRTLTLELGGTTANDAIKITIDPRSGLVPIIPGLFLNNAVVVRAYADAANVITITGYVNQAITA